MTDRPPVRFPLGPFTTFAENPVLRPRGSGWESACVYNPAAVVVDGRVVLLYRAHATDLVSRIGLATSEDGYHFEREDEPVLGPSESYDRYGCEDPRVTEIDGTYYLTYSGWDRTRSLLCLATSTDLRTWVKHGPILGDLDTFAPAPAPVTGAWSKAGGILPVPLDGRYLMYVGEGSIWAAWSTDLLHWTVEPGDVPVLAPTGPDTFGSYLVEVGPPPLVTDDGLILLLHNAAIQYEDGSVLYTCGQLLLSPDDPTRVLARMHRPWLEPTTHEEQHGLVPDVTFVEGLVHLGDTWFAYYGQSDTTVGVATWRDGQHWSELAKVPR